MKDSLNRQGRGIIAMLVMQYLLGMATNLYVKFPEGAKEGQLWVFAWSQIQLALHIILGILLLVTSIVMMVRASRANDLAWKTASTLGFFSILLAGFGGAYFISSQMEVYSYLMAIGFLGAFSSYVWGIYKNK